MRRLQLDRLCRANRETGAAAGARIDGHMWLRRAVEGRPEGDSHRLAGITATLTVDIGPGQTALIKYRSPRKRWALQIENASRFTRARAFTAEVTSALAESDFGETTVAPEQQLLGTGAHTIITTGAQIGEIVASPGRAAYRSCGVRAPEQGAPGVGYIHAASLNPAGPAGQ